MRSKLIPAAIALPLILLAACNRNDPDNDTAQVTQAPDSNGADSMASNDQATADAGEGAILDAGARTIMQAQVVLDRLGFSSGVIDGKQSMRFTNALHGFQEAQGLPVTGELDDATRQAMVRWNTIPATRLVTIPASWGQMVFMPIPEGAPEQAKMAHLGYESMAEALAERFHTTPEVLAQLNRAAAPAAPANTPAPTSTATPAGATPPPMAFAAGQEIRVPNVGGDRVTASDVDDSDWLATMVSLGVGTDQPKAARIEVDKSDSWLKAFDEQGKLVAMFTVTTGSGHDPLPLGDWGINGVSHNPHFAYDPELFWDVPDSAESQQLPPGPNGSVGVVWIDLTKEHYGIHGTPAPETVGTAQSHGCVRLTNWDAARLAEMVSGSTKVVFKE